jgi:hypothetical protein
MIFVSSWNSPNLDLELPVWRRRIYSAIRPWPNPACIDDSLGFITSAPQQDPCADVIRQKHAMDEGVAILSKPFSAEELIQASDNLPP